MSVSISREWSAQVSSIGPTYYNDNDKFICGWLAELMSDGLLPKGIIDARPIHDVLPGDLRDFHHCHFFAGISGWSYALALAQFPPEEKVWTGSCPCPSFSVAGKGEGFSDPRHLWPAWEPLIRVNKPPVIFGEQAPGAIGHGWLDLVSADLERSDYAVGAAVLGACSVGAPHRRQRLYFVADSQHPERRPKHGQHSEAHGRNGSRRSGDALLLEHPESLGRIGRTHNPDSGRGECSPGYRSADGFLGNSEHGGRETRESARERAGSALPPDAAVLLADPDGRHESDGRIQRSAQHGLIAQDGGTRDGDRRPGPVNNFWRNADWIFCRDRRWRPVEPGTFPLATGLPNRVGRLRGAGNSISPQVAAEFIQAYLDSRRTG